MHDDRAKPDSDGLRSSGSGQSRAAWIKNLLLRRTDALAAQALRYVVVGFVATIADMGALYALTEFVRLPYLVSAAAGFVLGVVVNYFLSVTWVFQGRTLKDRRLEFSVFALIGLVGLGLTEVILFVGVEWVHLHYMGTKVVAVVVVFAWNFGMRRALLFRPVRERSR